MNTSQDLIGVFDSGLGGLSVLRHLRRCMPEERFLYYGDSANAPYGIRPREEITELTLKASEHLMEQGLKALVIACNTATAAAIDILRDKYADTIIIGIEPALKPAADRFPGGGIGVMATQVTLQEEKFCRLCARCAGTATVYKIPAPEIVPLVEAGKADSPEMDDVLRHILGPYTGRLDALVLGCTHFPFASAGIRRVLGDDVLILDGGEGTARETRRRLVQAGLLRSGTGELIIENSCISEEMLRRTQTLLNAE